MTDRLTKKRLRIWFELWRWWLVIQPAFIVGIRKDFNAWFVVEDADG